MRHRILTCPSLSVEGELVSGEDSKKLYMFWMLLIKAAGEFKNTVYVAIPNKLIPFFHKDHYLKSIYALLYSSSQYNVGFQGLLEIDGCVNEKYYELYGASPVNMYISEFLTSLVHYNKFPFVIGDRDIECKKLFCDLCKRGLECADERIITQISLDNFIAICEKASHSAKLQLDCSIKKNLQYTEQDLRFLTFLIACFYKVPDTLLNTVDMYAISPGLVDDINKSSITPLIDILFSMFRSAAYPSRSGAVREQSSFAIDWHINNPSRYNEFDLYRVDVVPMGKTGLHSSGVKRLLMGKNEGKTYFLAFTERHDFSLEIIKIRTDFYC